MKKDYLKFLDWAVVYFVPRETQDDKRDKLEVSAIFRNPANANDYVDTLQNKDRFFIIDIDDLERFEEFYNYVNDLNEDYADYWTTQMDESIFSKQEQNKYKYILGL